jgi:2-polyprenyl-3-methyl-5-hydroxy-6-metoxy-1,4-benzoquinol methylase
MPNTEELRFGFGKNWSAFLSLLDEERINQARLSIDLMLGEGSLAGKTFLDIGSGSGLFSLAARQRGAKVYSFDYDPDSVACTKSLRDKFFAGDPDWKVEQGSVLDKSYLSTLGQFDIVYSWGVLHHTGSMWEAIENACRLVAPKGKLFIALYNDQKGLSKFWIEVKKIYCASDIGRKLVLAVFLPFFAAWWTALDIIRLRNPVRRYTEYKSLRGMSRWTDMIDWLGGYPFEVSTPEAAVDFVVKKGFVLVKLKTVGSGLANNEFVFVRA